MFKLIFGGAFLLFFLLALLVGMLKGKKYIWQYSLSRILMLLASVVLSALFSVLLGKLIGSALFNLLNKSLFTGESAGLLSALPSAPDALRALTAMIVAPIIFFILFFIIKAILNCFNPMLCGLFVKLTAKISGKAKQSLEAFKTSESASEEASESITPDAAALEEPVAEAVVAEEPAPAAEPVKKEKKKKRKYFYLSEKFDTVGAVLGAVCSFFVLVVALTPLVGFLNTVDGAMSFIVVSEDSKAEKVVVELTDAAADNMGCKTVKVLGGQFLYDRLTTYKVMDQKATLAKETEFLADMGNSAVKIADKNQPREDAAAALKETSGPFERTTIARWLLSDFLSGASESWSNGEKFYGIACPSFGEDADAVIKDFTFIMKDTNEDLISSDYATIINAVAVLVENDATADIKNTDGMKKILGDEAVVSAIMLEFLENERMTPMVGSITNMGVSLMAKTLDVSEDNDRLYSSFIEDMSYAYRIEIGYESEYARLTSLSTSVADVYDRHGISITKGVSTCIAASMIAELQTGSEQEMQDFFASNKQDVVYLSTSERGGEAISLIDKIAKQITSSSTEEQIAAIAKAEFASASGIGDRLAPEELDELAEKFASDIHKDLSKGELKYEDAVFSNTEEFSDNTRIITRGELEIASKDVDDNEAEANGIAKVFSNSISMVDKISSGDFNAETLIRDFGPVLDAASGTDTIGADKAANLLIAVMQSSDVRNNIGWTLIQATNVADSVNRGAASGEKYEVLLKSVGQTVEVIKISSDDGDASEKINELMQDLTPTSAETLQELSTPEVVKNYGVSDKSAEPVADMMSDMFGNMSVAKENGMPESEYKKESIAVNDMMSIAMSAKDSNEKATFGENSATGITATEFVERVTDSVIVSETFVNSVYGKDGGDIAKLDPLVSGRNLSSEEKTELIGALDAKWKEHLQTSADEALNAEYERIIVSIASILNVNISISGNTITEVTGG